MRLSVLANCVFVLIALATVFSTGCGISEKQESVDRRNHAPKRAKLSHDRGSDPRVEAGTSKTNEDTDVPSPDALEKPAVTDPSPSERPVDGPPPKADATKPRPTQAGLLTAGSFDDHERLADFQQFVSNVAANNPGGLMPRAEFGRRVMIRVVNAASEPIGDARVQLAATGARQTLFDTKTGSDGRALFLTGVDGGRDNENTFVVTATAARQTSSASRTFSVDQPDWRIELHDARAKLPQRLDLALVIDTTGSMRDELDYLKTEIDDIAATVHKMFPNVDQRYALIVYRDDGDEYVTRTYDFTNSIDEFRVSLGTQHARGGGDYPEAMHVALDNAARLSWRGDDTARVLFLVGDAPPHPYKMQNTFNAIARLRKQRVRLFPVAASGAQLTAEFVMRNAAFTTLGQYLFLTDHSGIGKPHAAPHVPSFLVEKLNRLMIRMIASELAGAKLAPKEVLAIERGELDATRPPTIQTEQQQPPENQVSTLDQTPSELQAKSRAVRLVVLGLILLGVFVFDATAGRRRDR